VLLRVQGMVLEYEAQIEVQPNLPSVFGYAPWIEEVLANYVSNAIKYGGAPPRVTIGATVRERGVNFWVRDNGQGLSPDQRDILFKKAARFDSRQRGHGLGLMIVQRIMERLGGTAAVESTPGEGSSFSFTLPIDAQAVEVRAITTSEPGLTAAQRL
jgi:signal transduction histidine kinase